MKAKLIGWTAAGLAGVGVIAGLASTASAAGNSGTSSPPTPQAANSQAAQVSQRVIDRDDLLAVYAGRVAKWWVPDDVVVVDELPHTATGKIQKLALREQWRGHLVGAKAKE